MASIKFSTANLVQFGIFLRGLLLTTCLVTPLAVAQSATDDSVLRAERPSVNGEPTVVEISAYVLDVEEIDDVKQHFSIDLFFVARWQDPRLALPGAEHSNAKRLMSVDEIWTPRLLILNDRGLKRSLPDVVEVDGLGNVTFQNRLSGPLASNLEFRNFPFDSQRLPIDVVSYYHPTDELQFSPQSALHGRTDEFSIEGWHIERLDPVIDIYEPPAVDRDLPRLSFGLLAERDSDYYIFTMMVPMALIIFMAWTVFWIQPGMVPPRIAIATASIFSLIALGVSIRLGLPKVSYLTKADVFVLGCTLMVFLALGIAVIGSRWASSDRLERAIRINAISRWVYVLLFVAVASVAINY